MPTDTLDRIYIRDLAVRCIVGVFPEERTAKQDVIINIVLSVDLTKAGETDRLEDTVDYKRLKKNVLALAEESKFFLVEKLAAAVADICLAASTVQQVTVTIDKPGALRFARSVAVEITRSRGSDG